MNAKWVLGIFWLIGAALVAAPGPARASDEGGEGAAIELGTLRTEDGRTFHEARAVSADTLGLTFRHRGGVAKIDFELLSREIRDRYGYDKAIAEQKAEEGKDGEAPKTARAAAAAAKSPTPVEVRLRIRTRTQIRLPQAAGCGGLAACRAGVPWGSWWPRYHPANNYALFPCRQLAERDFLITSGILPVPPGVSVYPVPRPIRW